MSTKINRVFYVSQDVFEDFARTGNAPEKLYKFFVSNENNHSLSDLTKYSLRAFDSLCKYVLFGSGQEDAVADSHQLPVISKLQEDYVKDNNLSFLRGPEQDCVTAVDGNVTKCYEIAPYPTADYLILFVVVRERFLSVVTETKETLSEFFLSILRHCYDNKVSSYQVVREYLGLRLKDNSRNLVLNRLDQR